MHSPVTVAQFNLQEPYEVFAWWTALVSVESNLSSALLDPAVHGGLCRKPVMKVFGPFCSEKFCYQELKD